MTFGISRFLLCFSQLSRLSVRSSTFSFALLLRSFDIISFDDIPSVGIPAASNLAFAAIYRGAVPSSNLRASFNDIALSSAGILAPVAALYSSA